jgi:hypothetical protein
VLNAWLLFFVCLAMTRPQEQAPVARGRRSNREVAPDDRALWRSAFVAALFAIHPLHVESVAWVAERKDVLSAMFWFLTMGAYTWYVRQPGWRRMAVVAVSLALGLLCKPMLVTLPLVLVLLDFWPLGRASFAASPRELASRLRPLV